MTRFLRYLLSLYRHPDWDSYNKGGKIVMRRWRDGEWEERPATEDEVAEHVDRDAW
jgi:hypothetical protein